MRQQKTLSCSVLLPRPSFLKLMFILSLCLIVTSALAMAQSGRKQKKSVPEPPPQGVKAPEEKPEQPAPGHSDSDAPQADDKEKEKAPALRFLVGSAMPENFNVPMMYADIAREGCQRELRTNPAVIVSAQSNMTRGEAINAAKKDDKTYVVWIELVVDQFTANTYEGFDLRFALFEPKTGKVLATGSGYPQAQTGRTPLPPIGASRAEVRLELAGRDVGRRVLARLNVQPKNRFPVTESR
jgi:hypothetical protein